MKSCANRRSAMVAGVVATIGGLVIGASAFAGGRPASRALTGHTVAITRLGRTVASVTAGASRDISVLDAGTISLTIDGTTATFRVDTIVPVAGWTVEVSVRDGSHAAVVFTMGIRRVEASLVLDDRVLVVTITEVPQGRTSSTTATPPPSSSTSTSTVATTTPTTVASTAVPSTTASTVALVACQASREGDDDERGDDDCDDDEEQRTTTQTSTKASTKHDDDDDHDDHEEERGDKHESHDD